MLILVVDFLHYCGQKMGFSLDIIGGCLGVGGLRWLSSIFCVRYEYLSREDLPALQGHIYICYRLLPSIPRRKPFALPQ